MSNVLNEENSYTQKKLYKLKRMKFIATGLLVLMSVIYIITKKFEANGIVFSSIAAFSEAAIVGALADWFAVTALFRHPLGIRYIPHTAIIQKNRDKIGESLSEFVVSNFFTPEIIESKLKDVELTGYIISYLQDKKGSIADKTVIYIPRAVKMLLDSRNFSMFSKADLKEKLRSIDIYPQVNGALQFMISSGIHVAAIQQFLGSIYHWTSENKEETLKIIEGINRKLAFPVLGDLVYKAVLKILSKLVEEVENGKDSQVSKELLYNLPYKLIEDISTSGEFREKIAQLKEDIIDSEGFDRFVDKKAAELKESILNYTAGPGEELARILEIIMDGLIKELSENESIKEELDKWLKDCTINIVCKHSTDIALLIRDTIDKWPVEDMVEKLETQVGGDLQYIRINGTVIGGLVGLIIHFITLLL